MVIHRITSRLGDAPMDDAVDAFEDAVKHYDLNGMVQTTSAFYAIIFDMANRRIISELLQSLKARISTLRATSMSNSGRGVRSGKEMRAIANAIGKGIPDAAYAACLDHVQKAAAAAQLRITDLIDTPRRVAK